MSQDPQLPGAAQNQVAAVDRLLESAKELAEKVKADKDGDTYGPADLELIKERILMLNFLADAVGRRFK